MIIVSEQCMFKHLTMIKTLARNLEKKHNLSKCIKLYYFDKFIEKLHD